MRRLLALCALALVLCGAIPRDIAEFHDVVVRDPYGTIIGTRIFEPANKVATAFFNPVLFFGAKAGCPTGTTRVFLINGGSWIVDPCYNSANNQVEVLGAGSNGLTAPTSLQAGYGGGSGGYSSSSNNVAAGTVTIQVAAANTSQATWFNGANQAASEVSANSAGAITQAGANTTGATATGSLPVKTAGSSGGTASSGDGGAGGGGAGAPSSAGVGATGANGSSVLTNFGGNGGSGSGVGGGAGGSGGLGASGAFGTNWDASHGSGGGGAGGNGNDSGCSGTATVGGTAGSYGAGGGGGGADNCFVAGLVGGVGKPGIIAIRYTN